MEQVEICGCSEAVMLRAEVARLREGLDMVLLSSSLPTAHLEARRYLKGASAPHPLEAEVSRLKALLSSLATDLKAALSTLDRLQEVR